MDHAGSLDHAPGTPVTGAQPAESPHQGVSARLLDAALRADAPNREAELARLVAIGGWVTVPATIPFGAFIGWKTIFVDEILIVSLAAFHTWYYFALKRGFSRPWMSWLSLFWMVSLCGGVMVVEAVFTSPIYAMTSTSVIIWSALVVLVGIQAKRSATVVAGTLAAVEVLLVYFLVIYPRFPASVPHGLEPPYIFMRAFFLGLAGFLASIVQRVITQQAERAMRALREREFLGKYFLHEKIGSGGMAEVFRATYCPEGGFEKTVAVKRILPSHADDERFLELFRREARIGSLLNHRNVVQILDLGRASGTYFLAMELVDGMSLQRLMARLKRPLPLSVVSYVGAELCEALEYIHTRVRIDGQPTPLVHRDANPPNILLSRQGDVKLTDFGIAQSQNLVDATRSIQGKLGYLAPEQARSGPLDGKADIFALGLTLGECLTARRILKGDSDLDLLKRLTEFQPPDLDRVMPKPLKDIVQAMMAQAPADRPTPAEIRAVLLRLEGDAAPYPRGQQELAALVEEALLKGKTRDLPDDEDEATLRVKRT